MGVCVAKEKESKPMRFGHDRIITCTIDTGKEKIKQTYNSKYTIKELMNSLKKNHSKNENDKIINLYYKGNQITKLDQNIGEICETNDFNLKMVSISLSESMVEDNNKIQRALIHKLSSECNFHSGEKEINICLSCGMGFCDKCLNKHQSHKIINKNELIKYKNEIEEYKNNIYKALTSLGIDPYKNSLSEEIVCNDLRNDMSISMEKLNDLLMEINNKKNNVYNDFKNDFDSIFPFLLEYKEKVENLYDSSLKESVLSNEKDFLNFYVKYKSVKDNSEKINQKVFDLKNKIEVFKDILNDLVNKIHYGINCLKKIFSNEEFEETETIKKKNINLIQSVNIDNSNFITRSGRFSLINFNQNNDKKLNLMNLLSHSKDKKNLIKTVEQDIKERHQSRSPKTNKRNNISFNNNNLSFKNNNNELEIKEEEYEEPITGYYNIEVGSNNILYYSIKDKKVIKSSVNISETNIKRFESYHSTLNYKGKFYISRGYSSSKMFYRYNSKTKEFIKLSEMPTGHSYHCLIGVENNIFAISGFKSKKIEKYSLINNSWENLPELEIGRSWPGCVSVEDTYLLLFGGLCDRSDLTNKIIEKLNIKDPKGWEKIEINFNEPIPFYFGVVNINNQLVYLFGGKLNSREDNVNTCYKFNCNNGHLEKENNIKLPEKDEFDGKNFYELGNNNYGAFSSIFSDRFYIYNSNTQDFEIISLNNNS